MATDQDALLLQMSADIRGLEKQMAKASGIVDKTATSAERRWKSANDNMGKSFSPLRAAATSANSSLTSLAGGFAAVGPAGIAAGVAVAGFTVALRKAGEVAQFADDLSAAATRIGVTAEALQELRHAAEANDVSVSDLDDSLRNLNGSIGAIKTGIGAAKLEKAFAGVGITPAQLASIQTADQLLPLLADKIGKVGSQAEQVQIVRKLGIEPLLPLLQQGGRGIDDLRLKAHQLGLVMDEETVQGAAAMNEELRLATERSSAASRRLGAEFIPTLVALKNAAAAAAGALAGMFAWMNRDSNPDHQIKERLRTSQKARERAAQVRQGPGAAFMTGTVSGLEAFSPAARERVAQRLETDATRIEGEIETISRRMEAKAKEAADRASAAARTAAGGSSPSPRAAGGSSGRARAARSPASGPTEEEVARTRDMADLQERIELAQAAANDKNVQALQDQLDRLAKIADYRKDGLDLAEATAKADAFIGTRKFNRDAVTRSREITTTPDGFVSTEDAFAKIGQQLDEAKQISDDEQASLRESFRSAFHEGIDAAISGDVRGLIDSLALRFRDKLVDGLADQLFDIVNGLKVGAGGSGGGAGSILKFVKGLFGGGGGSGAGVGTVGDAWAVTSLMGFADGGRVSGPGGPRSDSVPAMLSDGEFVINADATKKHRAILEAINSGRVPHLTDGGLVRSMPKGVQAFPNDLLRSLGDMRVTRPAITPRAGDTYHQAVSIHFTGPVSGPQARVSGSQAGAAALKEMAKFRRRGI